MRILTCLLLALPLCAADPAGFRHWKSADLKGYEKTLGSKVDPKSKSSSERFGNFGANATAMVSHREGNGDAEVHELVADFFVVQSGEATLVYGGQLARPRQTAANELRAPAIDGGQRTKISAGDIVTIPANTPHQLLVDNGKQITYVVIKVAK